MWESLKCEGPIYIIIIHYPLSHLEGGYKESKALFTHGLGGIAWYMG